MTALVFAVVICSGVLTVLYGIWCWIQRSRWIGGQTP